MRDAIRRLPGSKIRQVANAGLGRDDVLAFWFGEGDEVTPEPVREAAMRSLADGETFYTHNLGLPELRAGIAAYASRLHRPVAPERIAVTSSGVNALMLAAQLLVDAGDEVVVVTPVWPNVTAQPAILGGRVVAVPLGARAGAWALDVERLLAAVGPRTKAVIVNAPNNPTGWVFERAGQQALLEHCRRTGTWIVADEVYERLCYRDAAAAPSFLDLAEPEDRLLVAGSFSKSFLMTGWRLGWLVLPPAALEAVGKLIEFNTSCAPVFVQRGGLAALAIADAFVRPMVARLRAGRDRLHAGLARLPRIEAAAPPGGMYAFFRVDGEDDSLAFATRLVVEHGLGVAPGAAFGAEGEGWLRWCFASREPGRIDAGLERLAAALRV
jgi:aspartate/methionine/tyrosine aminotransferase